jgi:sortase A
VGGSAHEVVTVRRLLVASAAVAGAAGLLLLGDQACRRAKGALAARLVERACAAHLADGRPHRPWSWADHHPVARIDVPRLGVRRVVLSGASGSSLAFALGHVDGTALPGSPGNCVVTGHRDTWAAFLERVRVGDEIRVETRLGVRAYRVRSLEVVSEDEVEILEPVGETRLTLFTCYPFSGLVRSPWRLVVTCEPAASIEEAASPRAWPAPPASRPRARRISAATRC